MQVGEDKTVVGGRYVPDRGVNTLVESPTCRYRNLSIDCKKLIPPRLNSLF